MPQLAVRQVPLEAPPGKSAGSCLEVVGGVGYSAVGGPRHLAAIALSTLPWHAHTVVMATDAVAVRTWPQ